MKQQVTFFLMILFIGLFTRSAVVKLPLRSS